MFIQKKGPIFSEGCWWKIHTNPHSNLGNCNKKKLSLRRISSVREIQKNLKISVTGQIKKANSKKQVGQIIEKLSQAQINKNKNSFTLNNKKNFKNYPIGSFEILRQPSTIPLKPNSQIGNKCNQHYPAQGISISSNSPHQINHWPPCPINFSKNSGVAQTKIYFQQNVRPLQLIKSSSSYNPEYEYSNIDSPLYKTEKKTSHTSPVSHCLQKEQSLSSEQDQLGFNDQQMKEIQKMLFTNNDQEKIDYLTSSCHNIKKDKDNRQRLFLTVKQFVPKMTESDYGEGSSSIDSDQFSDVLELDRPQTPFGNISPLEFPIDQSKDNLNFSNYSNKWLFNN